MTNRNFMLLAGSALLTLSASAKDMPQTKKPNILYIFPDQYRMQALSIWSDPAYRSAISTVGDPVKTPNIDKLARRGVIFNNACSTFPVSSPHRGMLMSGMYPRENGIEVNCRIGRNSELKHDIVCLTDVLNQSGYETAYVGKTHWHKTEPLFDKNNNYVGTTEAPGGKVLNIYDTYIPEGKSRHGNKFWFQGVKSHYLSYTYSNRPELVRGKKDGDACKHLGFTAENEANVVIKYLKNENGEREAGKPFSIIWSINPPHPPYSRLSDCDSIIYQGYKDMPLHQLLPRKNASVRWSVQGKKKEIDIEQEARIYYSLVEGVDKEIGRVLQALEESGEADNTIIVFTSDHGEMMGSHERMGKGVIYEESFVVPYILCYPGVLKPQVNDLMFGSVDIMPTLLGLAGLSDNIPSSVMGHDYSDGILTGSYKNHPKPTSAAYLADTMKGIRTYQYTYVVKSDGSYELYDNTKDPYQMNPLRLENIPAADAQALKKGVGHWLKEAHDRWYDSKKHAGLIIY